jgi:hypothetical protein
VSTTDRLRRLIGVLLLGLLLVSGLSACDDGGEGSSGEPTASEPADPAGSSTRPAAQFDVQVTPEEDGVRVSYQLVNQGSAQLLVPNRLPVPAGAGVRYRSDLAYVTGGPDGLVQLSHRVFAWPDTDRKTWEVAPRVGVTRVAPGRSVSAELTVPLPLPLTRNQPFGDDIGYGTIRLPDPVKDVVFCLGVLPGPSSGVIPLHRDDGVRLTEHGNSTNSAQFLFCSDPVPLS